MQFVVHWDYRCAKGRARTVNAFKASLTLKSVQWLLIKKKSLLPVSRFFNRWKLWENFIIIHSEHQDLQRCTWSYFFLFRCHQVTHWSQIIMIQRFYTSSSSELTRPVLDYKFTRDITGFQWEKKRRAGSLGIGFILCVVPMFKSFFF